MLPVQNQVCGHIQLQNVSKRKLQQTGYTSQNLAATCDNKKSFTEAQLWNLLHLCACRFHYDYDCSKLIDWDLLCLLYLVSLDYGHNELCVGAYEAHSLQSKVVLKYITSNWSNFQADIGIEIGQILG